MATSVSQKNEKLLNEAVARGLFKTQDEALSEALDQEIRVIKIPVSGPTPSPDFSLVLPQLASCAATRHGWNTRWSAENSRRWSEFSTVRVLWRPRPPVSKLEGGFSLCISPTFC